MTVCVSMATALAILVIMATVSAPSVRIDVAANCFEPSSASQYEASVLTLWNVLKHLAHKFNYGCNDKSPLSNPRTSCTAKSDRFNAFMFGSSRPVQMREYSKHMRRINATTYCEVGMNTGLGTVAALSTHPKMVAHSFDLMEWRYTPAIVDFISMIFPGRHEVHAGSSFTTLPQFAGGVGARSCDAALVDGAHTETGAATDIANMRAAMKCNHVIFLDDLDQPSGTAVRAAIQRGELEMLEEFSFPPDSPEACIYMYKKRQGRKHHKMLRDAAMVEEHYHLEYSCPNVEMAGGRPWAFGIARYKNLPHCV